jgi:hypothetical protein
MTLLILSKVVQTALTEQKANLAVTKNIARTLCW